MSAKQHSLTASSGTCDDNASHELPSASVPASLSAHGLSLVQGMHLVHPVNTKEFENEG